jgi:hypothetical protein
MFRSNDPSQPRAQVRLEAIVLPHIQIEPAQIHLGTVAPGSSVHRNVRVFSPRNEAFAITGISNSGSGFSFEFSSESEAVSHTVIVHWRAGRETNSLQEQLEILTNHAEAPRLGVSVVGEIAGSIRVSPKALFFGSRPPASIVSRKLIIRHPVGTIEIGPLSATNEVEVQGANTTHAADCATTILDVYLRMPTIRGPFSASLKIPIGVVDDMTLVVPLVGQIVDATMPESDSNATAADSALNYP